MSTMVSDFVDIVVDDFAVVSDELDFESLLQAAAPSVSDATSTRPPMILIGRTGI
jgi:hypothetical protein